MEIVRARNDSNIPSHVQIFAKSLNTKKIIKGLPAEKGCQTINFLSEKLHFLQKLCCVEKFPENLITVSSYQVVT